MFVWGVGLESGSSGKSGREIWDWEYYGVCSVALDGTLKSFGCERIERTSLFDLNTWLL